MGTTSTASLDGLHARQLGAGRSAAAEVPPKGSPWAICN